MGLLQPTTLVCLKADIGPLVDGTDAALLAGHGLTADHLADPAWQERMLRGQPVPTQELA